MPCLGVRRLTLPKPPLNTVEVDDQPSMGHPNAASRRSRIGEFGRLDFIVKNQVFEFSDPGPRFAWPE